MNRLEYMRFRNYIRLDLVNARYLLKTSKIRLRRLRKLEREEGVARALIDEELETTERQKALIRYYKIYRKELIRRRYLKCMS